MALYNKKIGGFMDEIRCDEPSYLMLLITNVVPLLLGTFAETCSLNLPQKGRKAGHDCLWAVA